MSASHIPSVLTPNRVLIVLGLLVAALGAAVVAKWMSLPGVVTIRVDEPVGGTVFFHFVVDGRPESRTDIVPVAYDFQAHHVSFAVITSDASSGPLRFELRAKRGGGTSMGGDGVKGEYSPDSTTLVDMSPHEVQTMRAAVLAEQAHAEATP